MESSSDPPRGSVGIPVGSPFDPTAGVVGATLYSASPLGAEELGRELSSTSAVACESEVDAWAEPDLISLTFFIRAFNVVEYSE